MAKSKTQTEASNPLLTMPSPAEVKAICDKGVMAAQVLKLGPGEAFQGKLLEKGFPIPYTDASGDSSPLPTWRFEHASGAIVDLLSSHQLCQNLPELVGCEVFVQMEEKKDIGGKMVNQFKVVNLSAKNKVAKKEGK